ncbi:MAG: DUF6326 family protein [Chloroflexota bacterium]
MKSTRTETRLELLAMQTKLSTLWIFALLNVVFRDIHELFRPGFLAEIMTGTVGGVEMNEGLLLQAGIMLELLIVMVLLARILPYRPNRWANIVVGLFAAVYILISGTNDLDDIFFAAIELLTSLLIVWFAWTWPNPEAEKSRAFTAASFGTEGQS